MVTLLMAVAPVQGFVVCFEADGGICFRTCCEREGYGRPAETGEPILESSEKPCCSCVDIAIAGQPHGDRIQPKLSEITVGPLMMTAPVVVFQPFVFRRIKDRSPPPKALCPRDSLAHIRSVVLLV